MAAFDETYPRLNFIMRFISWSFSGFRSGILRTLRLTVPAFPMFAWFYHYFYNLWLNKVGQGSWPPAWPAPRTRLVLLMVTIPVWGFCMSMWMISVPVAKWVSRATLNKLRRRHHRSMSILDMGHTYASDAQGPRFGRRRTRKLQWVATLGIYASLAVAGVYMFETSELPGDHRYRPDIEAAIRSPRPEGYGNGGESNAFNVSFCWQ